MAGLRRMRRRYRGIPVVVVLLAALAFGLTSSSADTADPATAPIANDVSSGLQSFAQSLTGLDSLNQLGQSLPFTSQVPTAANGLNYAQTFTDSAEGEARRASRVHLPDRARGLPLDRHLRHLRRRRRHGERNGLSPDRGRAAVHGRAVSCTSRAPARPRSSSTPRRSTSTAARWPRASTRRRTSASSTTRRKPRATSSISTPPRRRSCRRPRARRRTSPRARSTSTSGSRACTSAAAPMSAPRSRRSSRTRTATARSARPSGRRRRRSRRSTSRSPRRMRTRTSPSRAISRSRSAAVSPRRRSPSTTRT